MRDTRYEIGSALILAVVLTSLLAIVGVMFLMVARVNRMATSGISENKELDSAVETVIAKISQELVLDTPGAVDPNEEYYDYPDSANRWLASLEPYEFGGIYYWRHITDLYRNNFGMPTYPPNYYDPDDYFAPAQWDSGQPAISNWYLISPYNVVARIIADSENTGYTIIDRGDWNNDADLRPVGRRADADGDGVADSRWIKLPNMSSSKGKPIYAAIRIIDNGGMLNVNTAYKFDPNTSDGSSQLQINLAALSQRGANSMLVTAANKLQDWRCGIMPTDLSLYEQNVVWRYNEPNGVYTPFDISDELKLQNRYIINKASIDTRISALWTKAFNWKPYVPRNKRQHSIKDPNDWFWKTNNSSWDVNEYDYRHITTTYNMDRIINPSGRKMVNVNRINPIAEPNITDLYNAIRMGFAGAESIAAQMAVNLKDYSDDNDDVSTILVNGATYYGFERPCVYISELVYKEDVDDPNHRSYAVELYKPYDDSDPDPNWQLVIDESSILIDSWTGGKQFYVIRNEDPCAPLPPVDSNAVIQDSNALVFNSNSNIFLQRFVADVNNYIVVDFVQVPDWLVTNESVQSFRRDITLHKCIRRLWSGPLVDSTLGQSNNYIDSNLWMIQAHPANARFTNIGEIGTVFHKSAYPEGFDVIEPSDTEDKVRINLADPRFQQIFNYLTVFDPSSDLINNDGDYVGALENIDENNLDETPEWKIPGRININTAPWYVIAQLPWMELDIAQAVVLHRDTPGVDGFESIGELMQVAEMDYHAVNPVPLPGFPDLTPNDGVGDDFEERDVIFSRISNLVTVRSDVFTAYILVRIGIDGPQKRVTAILDRSNVYSGSDKVRIVALHPVPDPR